jgi:hypothetical protein
MNEIFQMTLAQSHKLIKQFTRHLKIRISGLIVIDQFNDRSGLFYTKHLQKIEYQQD